MRLRRVHLEAPPRTGLEAELQAFLAWFESPPPEIDGLVRAGLADLVRRGCLESTGKGGRSSSYRVRW